MYPAAGSTARPSGSRHPVTRVFESEPSGLSEKMRPPLRSSTNRRPLDERESVMFPRLAARLDAGCKKPARSTQCSLDRSSDDWSAVDLGSSNRSATWRVKVERHRRTVLIKSSRLQARFRESFYNRGSHHVLSNCLELLMSVFWVIAALMSCLRADTFGKRGSFMCSLVLLSSCIWVFG